MPVSRIATFTAGDPTLPAAHALSAPMTCMFHCAPNNAAADGFVGLAGIVRLTPVARMATGRSVFWYARNVASGPTSPNSASDAADLDEMPVTRATPAPSSEAVTVPP